MQLEGVYNTEKNINVYFLYRHFIYGPILTSVVINKVDRMQRVKGQPNSIPNERIDERLDTWRNQPNQAYGSALTASNIPDPYLSNYYAFHCLNQGVSDGTWSSGGDPMAFLGPIGREQPPPYMDGRLFGQNNFGSFNQGFAYLPATGGDYSAWGNSALNPRKAGMQNDNHEDYYSRDIYNAPAYQTTIKHLEHRIDGISLQTPHQNSYQFFKDGYGKSDAMIGTESHSNDTHFGKKGGVFPMPTSGITLNEQPIVHKKLSWASIASKPAKSQSKAKSKSVSQTSTLAGKQNSNSMDIGTWDNKNGNNDGNNSTNKIELPSSQVHSSPWNSPRENRHSNNQQYDISHPVTENSTASPFFDKQYIENNYNPKELDINTKNARFFIIKSYSEDDVYRSIKYSVWCSTEHGNKRLDAAYRENEDKGAVYLFYSVNASGHFCGMAKMVSPVDYASDSGIWAQDKWKGQFNVKWIYVKDVPNSSLRHIRLENNENKPVTNSRDTQEVPLDKGEQVLKIIHNYKSDTSIFDDKNHYEMRQKEEEKRKYLNKEENQVIQEENTEDTKIDWSS